jgi:type II restriction/modification system DNA methylase subunit YeeA
MSQEQIKDMNQFFYRASAADFMKIPGGPVAYWVSDDLRSVFLKNKSLGELGEPRLGMATGNNDLHIRCWQEVSYNKVGLNFENRKEAESSQKKWFPYNKGGQFRRWYGNNEYLVNWEKDGEVIRTLLHPSGDRVWGHNFNLDYIFKSCLTFTATSSSHFGIRYSPAGFLFDNKGSSYFTDPEFIFPVLGFLASKPATNILKAINPTIEFQPGNISILPFSDAAITASVNNLVSDIIQVSREDWNSLEVSWGFSDSPLLKIANGSGNLLLFYQCLREHWKNTVLKMQRREEENNRFYIETYGLEKELTADVSLKEITLTCNPHYRYGGKLADEEREARLQSDTLTELVSYALGCMMGRYSLDKPGLILASQGETLDDYLNQIPKPQFAPDDDSILPLTDQEWFPDDATNRFREFVRVVWGEEHLQENLDFVAESLCLHAIKPKRGESALDTIRRYLSTQFYKDHMRTYKKRPIYWLFSSGKHKAFECLVYLHRYNEGTLARMRTEYVIPLSAKLSAYAEKLEQDKDASNSAAETKRLEKEIATLHKQQTELAEFDEKLRHYADQRISLDLDDGVKVNYGKFGDLLAEVKAVTGENPT